MVLVFDNTFSKLRGKTVAYLVGTEKPISVPSAAGESAEQAEQAGEAGYAAVVFLNLKSCKEPTYEAPPEPVESAPAVQEAVQSVESTPAVQEAPVQSTTKLLVEKEEEIPPVEAAKVVEEAAEPVKTE